MAQFSSSNLIAADLEKKPCCNVTFQPLYWIKKNAQAENEWMDIGLNV